MSIRKRKQHTTIQQFNILLECIERNPSIATGGQKTAKGRKKNLQDWENTVEQLNAAGPPQNDVNGWKKVFKDWKYKIKSHVTANKKKRMGTGGGPCNVHFFNEVEERLIELLSINECVEGINEHSFGASQPENVQNSNIFEELELNAIPNSNVFEIDPGQGPSTTPNISPPTPPNLDTPTPATTSRIRKNSTKNQLLQKQITAQEEFYKKMDRKLNKILDVNKENLHTTKKLLKFKEKKLQYIQERDKIKQQNVIENLQLKKLKIELKTNYTEYLMCKD